MITAVDTNVLADVFLADPTWGERSAAALRQALGEGRLVVCGVVWAELLSAFPEGRVEPALQQLGIAFDPLQQRGATLAGSFWRRYRGRGGGRERVVADFLVGAHALEQADRLLTRDRGFYRDYFAGLTILAP